MDEFKKYLQQHRNEMDVDIPSRQLLQRIQQQTTQKKKGKLYRMVLRSAAAACIIAVIAVATKWMMKEGNKKHQDISVKEIPVQADITADTLAIKINDSAATNIASVVDKAGQSISNKKTIQKKEPIPYQLMRSFEHNYTQLVNLQLKSIRSTPVYGETQDYFNGFKITLRQIDTDETAIKKNIKTNGLNDELLEQLINVYQEKINLLKKLQHEINNMNNKVKENQQPTDSIKSNYINI